MRRGLLLEGVLHLLAGLLEVACGLVLLALRLQVAVVRGAAKDNYTLSSIVLGIVHTDAFRKQGSPKL